MQLKTADFAQERSRVERATSYYERFAQAVSDGEHARVARYYQVAAPIAPALLRFKALFFATRLEPVLAHIEDHVARRGRPVRALDLGCGYGLETTLLAAAGADITGVDSVASKIETAQALSPLLREAAGCGRDIRYRKANIFDYRPHTPYDLIYSSATLHHIEPARDACRAIARLLAPGGSFFLSDENGLNPLQQLAVQRKIGWLSPRVVSTTDPQTGEQRQYGNENIRPPLLWRRYLQAAGLRSRGIKYCRFLPPLRLEVAPLLRAERALRALPVVRHLAAVGFVEAYTQQLATPSPSPSRTPHPTTR